MNIIYFHASTQPLVITKNKNTPSLFPYKKTTITNKQENNQENRKGPTILRTSYIPYTIMMLKFKILPKLALRLGGSPPGLGPLSRFRGGGTVHICFFHFQPPLINPLR